MWVLELTFLTYLWRLALSSSQILWAVYVSSLHTLLSLAHLGSGSRPSNGEGVPVADPGVLEGRFWYTVARSEHEFFKVMSAFGGKTRPLRSFLKQTTSPTSPIDLFSNEFLLKYSKVSHSSSFLSSVAGKGGGVPFSLISVYLLC